MYSVYMHINRVRVTFTLLSKEYNNEIMWLVGVFRSVRDEKDKHTFYDVTRKPIWVSAVAYPVDGAE